MKAFVLVVLIALGWAGAALAHETTRSYLTLTQDGPALTAHVRIAFRDIEVAVWIDEDLDGQITWGETSRRIDAVSDYVTSALRFETVGLCEMRRRDAGASQDGNVAYLDLTFDGRCPEPAGDLRVTSRLFAEFDPDHRLFLTARGTDVMTNAVLGSAENAVVVTADSGGALNSFFSYFKEGVRHLLEGADHLVFLVVLLLPALASGDDRRRQILGVVGAVTGFTIAHALSLTAAATDILRPPTALIETLIALSIVITAFDNLRPVIPAPRAAVASFFGLIHGFGFATALSALDLSGFGFALALVGFNLGIEAAQIGVIFVLLPALSFLGFGTILVRVGSLFSMALGIYWVWTRVMPL